VGYRRVDKALVTDRDEVVLVDRLDKRRDICRPGSNCSGGAGCRGRAAEYVSVSRARAGRALERTYYRRSRVRWLNWIGERLYQQVERHVRTDFPSLRRISENSTAENKIIK
jgi:hypothetical protein